MNIRRIVSSNWNRLIESDIKKIVQPPLVAYSYDRTIGSLICNYPQFARSEHATKWRRLLLELEAELRLLWRRELQQAAGARSSWFSCVRGLARRAT